MRMAQIMLLALLLLPASLLQAAQAEQNAADKPLPLSIPTQLQHSPRVVALNWSSAEMLLSLGIQPVAMTSINGYRTWQSNHPALPEQVVELGDRAFPSLETIEAQQAQLIVGYPFRHARLLTPLTTIAPTLLLQQFARVEQTDYRYLQQMRDNYRSLALAVGKQALAEQQLQQMDAELTRLRTRLADANLQGKKVVYGKFVGMGYGLRIFSQQSLAASIAQHLGLRYEWDINLPGKDFTHVQLEQVNWLQDSALILVDQGAEKGRRMTDSPLWAQHEFVKNDDIYRVPALWSFGGPVSALRMARAFTHTLLEKQHAR